MATLDSMVDGNVVQAITPLPKEDGDTGYITLYHKNGEEAVVFGKLEAYYLSKGLSHIRPKSAPKPITTTCPICGNDLTLDPRYKSKDSVRAEKLCVFNHMIAKHRQEMVAFVEPEDLPLLTLLKDIRKM